ncbi:MAG: BrnA antitoxin family protein [Burkholderiales bacterium]
MPRTKAEPRREIDFAGARRGAIVDYVPGKTKISIRLDNVVLEHFRREAEAGGGGNYQTLINDALRAWIERDSTLASVRRVLREELVRYAVAPKPAHGQPSVPASGVRRKAAARRDARRDDTR